MSSKNDRKRSIATILIGFSILMFGMSTMSSSVSSLKDVPEFTQLFVLFSNPIIGMLVGAILTAVIQSSSALSVYYKLYVQLEQSHLLRRYQL